MTGPWLDGAFAVAFALVALIFAGRMLAARRSAETAHLLMGIGMLVMFVPTADPLPAIVWILIFVVSSAWVVSSLVTRPESGDAAHLRHALISNAGMIYMFSVIGDGHAEHATVVAMASTGPLAHDHSGGLVNLPPLTIAFTGYFLCHALWTGFQLVRTVRAQAGGQSGSGPVAVSAPPILFGAATTGVSHVVMGLGMTYMFTQMLP